MEMAKRNGIRIPVGTFHTSHTRAGMAAYKKASPETTVEVADRTILPVDGFGTTGWGGPGLPRYYDQASVRWLPSRMC